MFLLTSVKEGGADGVLQRFLAFYRENKDLLMLLANGAHVSENGTEKEGPSPKKEDRPADEGDPAYDVLREYLARQASA